MTALLQCEDFLLFQKALKQLRDLDDKIIYALNLSTPTASIQARGTSPAEKCLQLKDEIEQNYSTREQALAHCISVLGERVRSLKREVAESSSSSSSTALVTLREKQSLLRLMKFEQNVEEIIRDRTRNAFHEKCNMDL